MSSRNGRLDFGIGAGWNEYEHTSMGIPLYAPGERIRRLGEACEIIRRLFTQPLTDFDGRYYQLKEARCEPKPVQKPYPPFVIGGGGEQLTLRVVAQYADVWNFIGGPMCDACSTNWTSCTSTAPPWAAIRPRSALGAGAGQLRRPAGHGCVCPAVC